MEAQIEETNSEHLFNPEPRISAEELQTTFKKKDLLLSRRRIVQQLELSSNERYSELLRRTLAGLDAEIGALN